MFRIFSNSGGNSKAQLSTIYNFIWFHDQNSTDIMANGEPKRNVK